MGTKPKTEDIPEIKLRLSPEVVEGGARILSSMQGCVDPQGQRGYYRDLFMDLMNCLVERGLAAKAVD